MEVKTSSKYLNFQFRERGLFQTGRKTGSVTIHIDAFLSADSFSSALLVRLEEDGDGGDGDDDFFQKFGKERKNLLTDLFRRST